MYSRNANQAQYGPSGAFAFVHKPIIQCNNPLLTAQEVAAICTPANIAANHAQFGLPPGNNVEIWVARRNVEGGGRLDNYGSDAFRQVLGLKGAINDVWTYDAYAQAGLVNFRDVEGNFLGDPQITNALDVIPNPAKPNGQPVVPGVPVGAAVCASRVNGSDPNCVPWDIWAPGYGGPSSPGSPPTAAQQLAYVTVPSSWTSTVKEYVFNASTTGDLGKHGVRLPTANSGLNFNIGMNIAGRTTTSTRTTSSPTASTPVVTAPPMRFTGSSTCGKGSPNSACLSSTRSRARICSRSMPATGTRAIR